MRWRGFLLIVNVAAMSFVGATTIWMACRSAMPIGRRVVETTSGSVALAILIAIFAHLVFRDFAGREFYRARMRVPVLQDPIVEVLLSQSAEGVRLIISFERSTARLHGDIVVEKVSVDGVRRRVGEANLALIKPLVSWRIPKWLPVSDAGQALEIWPREINLGLEPLDIRLSAPIKSTDYVFVQFKLRPSLLGRSIESKMPLAEEEEVEIIARGRAVVNPQSMSKNDGTEGARRMRLG